jgi:hypothetical protein
MAAAICFGLLAGCTSIPSLPNLWPDEPIRLMNCRWDSNVKIGFDTEHDGGAPIIALAGQAHFFGMKDDGYPITVHGKFVIDWFDITGPLAANPRAMRPMIIEDSALQALHGKSPLGAAYTLVIDWQDYSPEVKHILIKTRFYPANGHKVFTDVTQVTLHGSTPVIASQTIVPPGANAPRPPGVSYGPPPPVEIPPIIR